MDICLKEKIPGLLLEPSVIFAYPTAVTDLHNPSIEKVFVPEFIIPSRIQEVKVASGYTGLRQNLSFRGKIYRQTLERFRKQSPLNFSDKFIFDARYDTDKNIAHLIRSATSVLFVKKSLSSYLGRDVTIYAVLRKNTPNLARQVYNTLDIPIICTDGNVYGEVIADTKQIQFENFERFIPELLNRKFKDYNPNTPERIFIPRRGNRSLINNDEVVEFLESRGFKTFYFEDLSISENWSIARNAKVVVTVHGASIAHFGFSSSGLQSSADSTDRLKFIDIFSPAFTLPRTRRFIKAVNGRWCAVRGQVTPKILRDLDFKYKNQKVGPHLDTIKSPFRVDLKTLEMAFDYLDVDS